MIVHSLTAALGRIRPLTRPGPIGWSIVAALALWPITAEYELFERFYEYSRAHEDWDVDELAMLGVNLVFGLLAALVLRSRDLRRALCARDREHARAEANARHDPLTGLPNRRAFERHLARLQAATSPRDGGAMVMGIMDLDRFKPVNDLHGHAAGDAILRVTAGRILDGFGDEAFVARLGGDEFAYLFAPGTTPEAAERAVSRVVVACAEPVQHEDLTLLVGVSAGLARTRAQDLWRYGLLHADKALYAAKRSGRGRLAWYDAELDRRLMERAAIEADLRAAIAAGAVEPHFQPVLAIDTGELCGFEVLARWTHPECGVVPPSTFIPIAEDTGLIGPLSWLVLGRACHIAAGWDARLKIGVNISPAQFRDAALTDKIARLLSETGFAPHRLEIEITESAVIGDFAQAKATITRLREMGIKIALDDFGTGYSSLSNLRNLPFDRIKIDRSFVTDIAHNPDNQKIVAGIMALARGLQLRVTAEGIESDTDLDFLSGLDCELGQGFLFDRALPADEVEWWLATCWGKDRPDAAGPAARDIA